MKPRHLGEATAAEPLEFTHEGHRFYVWPGAGATIYRVDDGPPQRGPQVRGDETPSEMEAVIHEWWTRMQRMPHQTH